MTIRVTRIWYFSCTADPEYFLPWESMPEPLKEELETNGGLECEGSGNPGRWCAYCRFGIDNPGEEL